MRWMPALGARCALGAALSCLPALGQEQRQEPAASAPEATASGAQAAASTEATTPRAVAARPKDIPSGAVQLAPSASPKPSRPAGEMLRLPLVLQGPNGGSKAASEPDAFGIASGEGRLDVSRPEGPYLMVPPRSVTIVTSQTGKASGEREELSFDRKTALPWLVVERAAAERAPRPAVPEVSLRTSRPFLTLARAIHWDAASSRHVAEFLFGLDPERGEPGAIDQPLDVRFSVSCEDVAPTSARILTVGPSGYESVKVSCSRAVKNESERQWLELFAGQAELRYPFRIPRRAGALELVPSSGHVLGFGFGRVVLTVRQLEEDGSPYRAPEPHPVQLLSRQGELDVPALTIPKEASETSIELRPSGIRPLELTAISDGQRSAEARVELDWPLLPIAAMLSGGALGGLVSTFGRGRRRHPLRRSLEGAGMGLLVTLTVLVVPGIASVVASAIDSELAFFVVAALAGFAGRPLIDRLARAVFPALAEPRTPP